MVVYQIDGIAPILSLTLSSASGAVLDATRHAWHIRDSQAATALVGIFTVLPFWLLALFRFPRPENH
jgi:hypothetical protein